MATTRLMTADDLLQMPDDDYQYELVRGVLIRMPPPGVDHGDYTKDIGRWMGNFVVPRGLGRVVNDAGFRLESDPDTVLAPDVAFVRADNLRPRGEGAEYRPLAPDLAVEVVSPSQSEAEVSEKVAMYLALGVPLVWAFFPRRRSVTVHRPGRPPQEFGMADELDGEDILPGFRLPIAAIFGESQ